MYVCVYIFKVFTTEGFFGVAIEKLVWAGLEPTTTEFRSDALIHLIPHHYLLSNFKEEIGGSSDQKGQNVEIKITLCEDGSKSGI